MKAPSMQQTTGCDSLRQWKNVAETRGLLMQGGAGCILKKPLYSLWRVTKEITR